MSEHRVEHGQQFTHTGSEGDLLGLACGQEPFIEDTKDQIVAHGHEGGHVEGSAHMRAPSPTSPPSAQLATVPAEGRDTNEGGDLSAVERPELGEASQQGEGQGWADARHAAQQVFPLVPQGTVPQAVGQVLVQVTQLLFEDGQDPVDAQLNDGQRPFPALLLGNLDSLVKTRFEEVPAI